MTRIYIYTLSMLFLFCGASCVKNLQQTRFFKMLQQQSPSAHSELLSQKTDVESMITEAIKEKLSTTKDYSDKTVNKVTFWFESKGSFHYEIIRHRAWSDNSPKKKKIDPNDPIYIYSAGVILFEKVELDYRLSLKFHGNKFSIDHLEISK